ncbi:transmembrane protein 218 isoform X2 [Mixophyes fleayi]
MAITVLGVGPGVCLIAVIWVVTLVLCILMYRASAAARLASGVLVFMAAIITIIMVYFPRESRTPSPIKEVQIVDTFFIGRYVLMSVASLIFLCGVFLVLVYHILEPVYARPLRVL